MSLSDRCKISLPVILFFKTSAPRGDSCSCMGQLTETLSEVFSAFFSHYICWSCQVGEKHALYLSTFSLLTKWIRRERRSLTFQLFSLTFDFKFVDHVKVKRKALSNFSSFRLLIISRQRETRSLFNSFSLLTTWRRRGGRPCGCWWRGATTSCPTSRSGVLLQNRKKIIQLRGPIPKQKSRSFSGYESSYVSKNIHKRSKSKLLPKDQSPQIKQ